MKAGGQMSMIRSWMRTIKLGDTTELLLILFLLSMIFGFLIWRQYRVENQSAKYIYIYEPIPMDYNYGTTSDSIIQYREKYKITVGW